jgi:hypothetical protein
MVVPSGDGRKALRSILYKTTAALDKQNSSEVCIYFYKHFTRATWLLSKEINNYQTTLNSCMSRFLLLLLCLKSIISHHYPLLLLNSLEFSKYKLWKDKGTSGPLNNDVTDYLDFECEREVGEKIIVCFSL